LPVVVDTNVLVSNIMNFASLSRHTGEVAR